MFSRRIARTIALGTAITQATPGTEALPRQKITLLCRCSMLNFRVAIDCDERSYASIMQGMADKLNRIFNHRSFNLIAFSVIAIMTLIAYSNTFQASFHFDDNPSIVDNYMIKRATADNIIILMKGIRPVVYL